MYLSSGQLQYSYNPCKLIVAVDQNIYNYYRSLVPKYMRVKKQMYPAHISVVRNIFPPKMENWNKYNNQFVSFEYDSYIYNDETYYWLNVFSDQLEEIRSELGLTPFGDVTESPDGRHKFHITLGNIKN